MTSLAIFLLDGRRFGLPLECVERAIRAVAVTPLAGAPAVVAGVLDLQGRVVAVIDLRRRLGLPERHIDPADQLLIARSRTRTLALIVDAVTGVAEYGEHEWVAPTDIAPGTDYLQGIVRLDDDLVLIHDLDRFLSADEEQDLGRALRPD